VDSALERAAEQLRNARRLTVLTGAGVSAESGVPTFRDDDGFWERFPMDRFGTLSGLIETGLLQPARLADFVAGFIGPVADAVPNRAHRAIAHLQEHVRTTVITQNVDGLHQEAGSDRVHQIHGSLLEIVDRAGYPVRTLARADLARVRDRLRRVEAARFPLPRLLAALGPLVWAPPARVARPRVVFFGENLAEPDWGRAQRAVGRCDVMLVVGTSALVAPASQLPLHAMTAGAAVLWVDPRPAGIGLWLKGPAGQVVPALVKAAFG
jgi:NAD-dependent deacetylase